jgi:peptide/nickel transport system permease protein
LQYILRRLVLLVLTVWAAMTFTFALPRLMPGNPAQVALARYQGRFGAGTYAALKAEYGLDTKQSIVSQYFTYLGHTLTGNLGYSFQYYPEKVTTLIAQNLPWTIGLVGVSTVLAFMLGTLIGLLSAWKRGQLLDSLIVPTGVMMSSMPAFWIALIADYFLAFKLNWFPVIAATGTATLLNPSDWATIIDHNLLPGLVLTLTSAGGYILLMRNVTITVLNDDFVKFARAKGLRNRTIATRYAARNAILPNFTVFAISFGFIVSGAVAIEFIFDSQGVGYLLVIAVQDLDYNLIQGLFLVIIVSVLVAIFVADLINVFLDPRIRLESRS